MPIENNISRWFINEAIRLRREKWKAPHLLAEEIYTIFSRVPDQGTGQINAGQLDDVGIDGFFLDDLFSLNVPPLDLTLLDFPSIQPDTFDDFTDNSDSQGDNTPGANDGGDGGFSAIITETRTRTETRYERAVFPGKVSEGSGTEYTVEIFPNGNQGGVTDQPSKEITAKHPQISSTATIPADTWTLVWRVVEIEIEFVEVVAVDTGQVLDRSTNITGTKMEHMIFTPIWLT